MSGSAIGVAAIGEIVGDSRIETNSYDLGRSFSLSATMKFQAQHRGGCPHGLQKL
jgi:hypothetical protein